MKTNLLSHCWRIAITAPVLGQENTAKIGIKKGGTGKNDLTKRLFSHTIDLRARTHNARSTRHCPNLKCWPLHQQPEQTTNLGGHRHGAGE